MGLVDIVPTVFYEDLNVAIRFFTDSLGFCISFLQDNLCIVKKDDVAIHLVEHKKLARDYRPELRIATDDIDGLYSKVITSHPEILHPHLNMVTEQPWGLREFGVIDDSMACIIFQQPIEEAELTNN